MEEQDRPEIKPASGPACSDPEQDRLRRLEEDRSRVLTELRASEEKFRALVQCCPDGIFLETVHGEILDCNEAGLRMFGYSREEMTGLGIRDLVPEDFAASLPEEITLEETTGDVPAERKNRRKDGTVFPTEISTKLFQVGGEQRLLAYVRDITERKKAEAEHERLIAELRQALAEVKTLRGIVPICAKCKKIRDDAGYWRQVEEYVSEHSEAQFSHGICPDCVKSLYPELNTPHQ